MRHMDLNEFVSRGFLQEVNRQFLHPVGLALEVEFDDADKATRISGVWDCREEPEGLMFEDLTNQEHLDKAANVQQLQHEKARQRLEQHGWVVQPIGTSAPE